MVLHLVRTPCQAEKPASGGRGRIRDAPAAGPNGTVSPPMQSKWLKPGWSGALRCLPGVNPERGTSSKHPQRGRTRFGFRKWLDMN